MVIEADSKPITVWQRLYKDKYVFNHIEDGHPKTDTPKHMCEYQRKEWSKADGWKKTHCYLLDNVVTLIKEI